MCRGRKTLAKAAFCNDMLFPFEAKSRFCTFQGTFFSLATLKQSHLGRRGVLTHQLQREFSSLSTFDLLSFSKATSGTEWTFSPKQHLLFSGCQYVIVKPLLVASSLSLISSATRVSLGNDISKPRAQNHLITQLSSQKRIWWEWKINFCSCSAMGYLLHSTSPMA